jgi:hypothetical protein
MRNGGRVKEPLRHNHFGPAVSGTGQMDPGKPADRRQKAIVCPTGLLPVHAPGELGVDAWVAGTRGRTTLPIPV